MAHQCDHTIKATALRTEATAIQSELLNQHRENSSFQKANEKLKRTIEDLRSEVRLLRSGHFTAIPSHRLPASPPLEKLPTEILNKI